MTTVRVVQMMKTRGYSLSDIVVEEKSMLPSY